METSIEETSMEMSHSTLNEGRSNVTLLHAEKTSAETEIKQEHETILPDEECSLLEEVESHSNLDHEEGLNNNNMSNLDIMDMNDELQHYQDEQDQIITMNLSGKSLLKGKKDTCTKRTNLKKTMVTNEYGDNDLSEEKTAIVQNDTTHECSLPCVDPVQDKKKSNQIDSKSKKDPNIFNTNSRGSFACWVCYQKFTRCFGVKKHISQKHSKGLCAVSENDNGQACQLVLFCPQNCTYATSKAEAFSQHIAKCAKPRMQIGQGENHDAIEMQRDFMAQEYIELQECVTSGAIVDMIKPKPPQKAASKKKTKPAKRKLDTDTLNLNEGKIHQDDHNEQDSAIGIKSESEEKMSTNEGSGDTHSCHVCKTEFDSINSLEDHLKNEHKEEYLKMMNDDKTKPANQQENNLQLATMDVDKGIFICNMCNKHFSSESYLLKHMRIHKEATETRLHKCKECGKSFDRTIHLLIHMRIHTGEKPFKCSECGKSFSTSSNIHIHMRIHTGVKAFKCTECGKSFSRGNDLKTHMRIHTGEKPFKCTVCNKSFRTNSNIINHMRIHTKEKPYKCDQCDKKFGRSGDLIIHKRIHTGERPFKCDQCGISFNKNWNLLNHVRRKHNEDKFTCCKCGKVFNNNCELAIHMQGHSGEKPFECSECGQNFGRSSDLVMHMRRHTGDLPYKCKQCDKSFNRNLDLKTHMRIHTGELPFTCNECNKKFISNAELKRHMKDHKGEDVWKCSQCDKSFKSNSGLYRHTRKSHGKSGNQEGNQEEEEYQESAVLFKGVECKECGKICNTMNRLATHMRIHTGEKPFVCNECGKGFSQSGKLISHMRKHTGEKPFSCEECGKCFKQSRSLRSHVKVHSGERDKSLTCNECGKCFIHKGQLTSHMRAHERKNLHLILPWKEPETI